MVNRIVVNGRETSFGKDEIAFEEVAKIAHGEVRDGLSVTWKVPGRLDGGMLSVGYSVAVVDGMVFNAVVTGAA